MATARNKATTSNGIDTFFTNDPHYRYPPVKQKTPRSCVQLPCILIGVIVMCAISATHVLYMYTLHENNMWFTNIKEVEREISFRTESGLYYSFYKQLINAPSLLQGVYDLTIDNRTEHLNTINILARFNIYQEVILAVAYRMCIFLHVMEPIFWYITAIFSLHGLLVASLFGLAWLISESWLAGLLAACFYIANKVDTTRVEFVIPLRESFSLPFLWLQILLVSYYIRPHRATYKQKTILPLIWLSTFLFSLFWQFNQFILLLEVIALLILQVCQITPIFKVCHMYAAIIGSLLLVAVLQFHNTMIFCSFVFSLVLGALLIINVQNRWYIQSGVYRRVQYGVLLIGATFGVALILNYDFKLLFQQDDDQHINKFLLTKFGLGYHRDFDVRLYLCNGAFEFLDLDFVKRLASTFVFPLYVVAHGLVLVYMIRTQTTAASRSCMGDCIIDTERPDVWYHGVLCVLFGVLAITTQRMKYLWTPYMCVMAATLLADKATWRWIMEKVQCPNNILINGCRTVLTLIVLTALLLKCVPEIRSELTNLREFYDPDTVELMEWIKTETAPDSSFAGSMQLMAGVKLCTGRHIANHPHYENSLLRQRTKQLYQMYAKRTPDEVHAIMHRYNITYMILEDSICLAPVNNECKLPSILDVDNGMIPDSGHTEEGLTRSTTPRFCDQVRFGAPSYVKLFKSVFVNKTFRIYKVLV